MAWTIFNNPTLHRLGHGFISMTVGLTLYAWRFELHESFILSCVVLPVLLELIDTFCGGLLVWKWSERKEWWLRSKARGFTFSADSARDFLDYQIGWAGMLLVLLLQATWLA